jgi:hypothetical protein
MFRKIIALAFLSSLCLAGFSQDQDFRTWLDIGVEGKLFNRIDFSVVPELRLKNNSSGIEAALSEVNLSVPVTKFFGLGVEYRYKMELAEDRMENSNRFGIYAELDKKISDIRFAYRIMYLQEYTDILTSEFGSVPESMHRHKLSVKYKKKGLNIVPGISAEGFFTLGPVWDKYDQKWRFTAGIQYQLTKNINLGLAYKLQKEYHTNDPLTLHILNISLNYEL